jgi:23S rRNA (uracil1939-C5)-methyltransferase
MSLKENVPIVIDRLSKRGWGIGSSASFPSAFSGNVEVAGGLPGDELSVRLYKKRRGKWRGDLCSVLKPSSLRVQPRCPHVPDCGGCTWQQMDYAAQLREKQQRVEAIFAPLLSIAPVDVLPIVSCEDPWRYRNKMEFSFSQNRAGEKFLGLMIAGSRGHVLNLSECHLVSKWYIELLLRVRAWWEASGLAAYRMNDTGTLRTLVVREGKKTEDKLVMLTVSGNPAYALRQMQLKSFVETVKSCFPQEQQLRLSIFLRVQQIHKKTPTQFFEMHLYGPDHLLERMTLAMNPPVELFFKISPTSFFQPNTLQAEKLYSLALNMLSFPKKHVMDLYAGTATFGMAMASKAQQVTAIEINPHACFDAESNKQLNGFSNLEILCGDVSKTLEDLRKRPDFTSADLVVVDPPRSGLDDAAVNHLKSLRPEEILYVSCNPETQATNIGELVSAGYRLIKLQPVDQFPHTPHIENIALLSLNSG